MFKKEVNHPALETWIKLNDFIRDADEATCHKLLDEERSNRRRQQFMKRIHSRLNKARADRERRELGRCSH